MEVKKAIQIIGLEPGDTSRELKRKHREIAKKNHPDIVGADRHKEAILQQANNAYNVLKNCDWESYINKTKNDTIGSSGSSTSDYWFNPSGDEFDEIIYEKVTYQRTPHANKKTQNTKNITQRILSLNKSELNQYAKYISIVLAILILIKIFDITGRNTSNNISNRDGNLTTDIVVNNQNTQLYNFESLLLDTHGGKNFLGNILRDYVIYHDKWGETTTFSQGNSVLYIQSKRMRRKEMFLVTFESNNEVHGSIEYRHSNGNRELSTSPKIKGGSREIDINDIDISEFQNLLYTIKN